MVGLTGRWRTFWRNRSRGARYILTAIAALLILLAGALGTSPLWLTPLLQTGKPALEAALTRAVGAPVRIGAVAARIDWRPGFVLRRVTISGRSGPAVTVQAVRIDLSWLALSQGRLWPAFIGVAGARLNLRKTARGFHVVGLARSGGRPFDWRGFLGTIHTLRLTAGRIAIALPGRRLVSLQGLDAAWATGIKGGTLTAQATIPGVCGRCRADVEFSGRGFSLRHFQGAVGVRVSALDLHAAAALGGRARMRPLAGIVDGQLWTTWRRGRLGFVGGDARLTKAFVPATRFNRALAVSDLSGRFSLKIDRRGFRFYAADLVSDLAGVRSQTRTLSVTRRGRLWRVEADRVRLAQAAYVASRIRPVNPRLARWLAMDPVGSLQRLRLRLRPGRHWRYGVRTRFSGLGFGHRQSGPFFAQASGTLAANTEGGQLVVTGLHGLVRGPADVPGPLAVHALTARFAWQKDGRGLSWRLPALHLASNAGTVDATASGVSGTGQGPVLSLNAALRDVRISALKTLYPRSLQGHLRRWLARTVRGGIITGGHIVLQGPLRRFPFRHGGGVFQTTLQIAHGRYRFLPDWPAARDLAVTVTEQNAQLAVSGSGTVGGVAVPALAVHAGPLGTPGGSAAVRVRGQGDLRNLLRLVLPHVRTKLRPVLPVAITGAGAARLALTLHIPFSRRNGPLTLHGHVDLKNASLRYPLGSRFLTWRALAGRVAFNDAGPDGGHLAGRLLGGPFTLALKPRRHGGVRGAAQGSIDAAHVRALAGPARPYVRGAVAWHLTFTQGKRLHAAVSADLRGLALRLPYPAGKALGVPATAHIALASGPRGLVVQGDVPRHLAAAYVKPRGRLPGLWVGIGSAAPPKVVGPGLAVGVRSGYLAVTPWLALVRALGRAHLGTPQTRALLTPRALAAYVGSLTWRGRSFTTVHARFERTGTAWAGALEGPDIVGTVSWRPGPRPVLVAHLVRLVIPPRARRRRVPAGRSQVSDPHRLPAIRFTANSLNIDGHYVGRVAIDGVPYPDGFRFTRISLVRPHASVQADGQWTLRGGLPESLFTFSLDSRDLGRTLAEWGLLDQVAGGSMTAHGTLNWPGSPAAFALAKLEAKVQFLARNGRFVKVRQGAGKLLGIFNVDSIVHYLTLDFSDIFGRGFAFGRIDGTLIAQGGVAKTGGIHVQGASANVIVSGQTDLVAKTLDLKLRVYPHIQNNVTLATGLLGGPIAGAVMLLMQKIFAQEISQGIGTTYYIEGPWSKPSIHKKADKH